MVFVGVGTLSDRLAGLTRPDTAANFDGAGWSFEDCLVRVDVELFFVGVMGLSDEVLRGLM